MKISLVTDTYLPEINGVTTVLARMRAGLRDRGHDLQLIAPRYPRAGPDDEGVLRRPSVACPGYASVRLSWPVSLRVPAALEAHDIELPFPHRTLYFGVAKDDNAPPAHVRIDGEPSQMFAGHAPERATATGGRDKGQSRSTDA